MPTPHRLFRILQVLHQRQYDLVVALDHVHDPHNLSAVLRTADATGVSQIIWEPDREDPKKPNPEVAMGSERWVNLHQVSNLLEVLGEYRSRNFKLAAAHIGDSSVDFRSLDWTQPWVLVMGNEKRGCRKEILEFVDENVQLPMVGFVQSLNISVAAAVFLYEIQRQREVGGLYRRIASREAVERFYEAWNLQAEGFRIHELLSPLNAPPKKKESTHVDGRSRKPR